MLIIVPFDCTGALCQATQTPPTPDPNYFTIEPGNEFRPTFGVGSTDTASGIDYRVVDLLSYAVAGDLHFCDGTKAQTYNNPADDSAGLQDAINAAENLPVLATPPLSSLSLSVGGGIVRAPGTSVCFINNPVTFGNLLGNMVTLQGVRRIVPTAGGMQYNSSGAAVSALLSAQNLGFTIVLGPGATGSLGGRLTNSQYGNTGMADVNIVNQYQWLNDPNGTTEGDASQFVGAVRWLQNYAGVGLSWGGNGTRLERVAVLGFNTCIDTAPPIYGSVNLSLGQQGNFPSSLWSDISGQCNNGLQLGSFPNATWIQNVQLFPFIRARNAFNIYPTSTGGSQAVPALLDDVIAAGNDGSGNVLLVTRDPHQLDTLAAASPALTPYVVVDGVGSLPAAKAITGVPEADGNWIANTNTRRPYYLTLLSNRGIPALVKNIPLDTMMLLPGMSAPVPGTQPLSFFAPQPVPVNSCGQAVWQTNTTYCPANAGTSSAPANLVYSNGGYFQVASVINPDSNGCSTSSATGTGPTQSNLTDNNVTWQFIVAAPPSVQSSTLTPAQICTGNLAYNQITFGTGVYEDGSDTGSLGLNMRTMLSKGYLIGYHYSGGGNITATDLNYEPFGGQNDYASSAAWLDDPGVPYTISTTYNEANSAAGGTLIRSNGQAYVPNGSGTCISAGGGTSIIGPTGKGSSVADNGTASPSPCTFTTFNPYAPHNPPLAIQLLHNLKAHGGKLNAAAIDLLNTANFPGARPSNSYDNQVEMGGGNGPLIYHCGATLWFTGTASPTSNSNEIDVCSPPADTNTVLGRLNITRSDIQRTSFNFLSTPPSLAGLPYLVLGGYNDVTNSGAGLRAGIPLPNPYNDQMGTYQAITAAGTYSSPVGTRRALVVATGSVNAILPQGPVAGNEVCYIGGGTGTAMTYRTTVGATPLGGLTPLSAGHQQCYLWQSAAIGWTSSLAN